MQVTFKTPDALDEPVKEQAARDADATGFAQESDEWMEAFDAAAAKWKAVAEKFVRYGELVIVEFGADGGARVVPLK
jgi:hypothetical protein